MSSIFSIHTTSAALFGILIPVLAMAADPYPEDPDLMIHLQIDTTPPSAHILAPVPADDGKQEELGLSPFVAVIACKWPAGVFSRKWERLEIWSPGAICRHEFDPASKAYDLFVDFVTTLPGYVSQTTSVQIARLAKADIDWGEPADLLRKGVQVTLEALPSAPQPKQIRTVAVASKSKGATGNPGSVLVESDLVDAEVILDGEMIGVAPVRLLLGEGSYSLVIQKTGFQPDRRTLQVTAETISTIKAVLTALPTQP